MKTKIISLIGVFLISIFNNYSQAQVANVELEVVKINKIEKEVIPEVVGMEKYVLENRVQEKVLLDIDEKSAELIADGIESVEMTKLSITAIKNGEKDAAIDYIAGALGRLETISLRSPEMVSIPISRFVQTDDIDTDLGAIKLVKENILKSLEQNKFHVARKELESLISEVKIETKSIPIATYPAALKTALLAIEKDDFQTASSLLSNTLSTLVVEREYISLPCMRAEVLLEESLTIQPGHLDPIGNRKLLLTSAKNQIKIAYELGQIKKESSNDLIAKIDDAYSSIGTSKFTDKVKDVAEIISKTKNEYDNNEALEI